MVSFEAFFKVLTTVFAFIEGISNQIVPLFHKALDKRPARKLVFDFTIIFIVLYNSCNSASSKPIL